MSLVSGLLGASGATRAGHQIANTAAAGAGAINQAATNAQDAVNRQQTANESNVNAAGTTATGAVNASTGAANNTLEGILGQVGSMYSPYTTAGSTAEGELANYAASPDAKFQAPSIADQLNTPAEQFALQQGQGAIENSAAAQGLGQSGNTLEALTQFGQGTAEQYYNNAFNQAQSTFQTNQNATLNNLSTLINSGLSPALSYGNAIQNVGSQEAGNTLGAGYYAGNTSTDLAKYLASQGTAEQEYAGSIGLQGQGMATNLTMQGANGAAAGDMGAARSLGSMFGGFLPGMNGSTGGSGLLGGLSGLLFG